MPRQIDWQSYAGFANAVLHWSPDHFWQATPREFETALSGWQRHILGLSPIVAADQDDLERLTALFPDT